MQFGCFAFDEIIHVSDHPVEPSFGRVVFTLTFAFLSELIVFAWYSHAVPMTMSPLAKPSISSWAAAQYFPINPFWALSRSTAAASCVGSSEYGLVMFRSGLVFMR